MGWFRDRVCKSDRTSGCHPCVLRLGAGRWKAEGDRDQPEASRAVELLVAGLEDTQGRAPPGPVVPSRLQG